MSGKTNVSTEEVGGGLLTEPATRAVATDDMGNQVSEADSPGHGPDSAASARESLADNLASQRQESEQSEEGE